MGVNAQCTVGLGIDQGRGQVLATTRLVNIGWSTLIETPEAESLITYTGGSEEEESAITNLSTQAAGLLTLALIYLNF